MTTLEGIKIIGAEGIWRAGNGLRFNVIVKDVRKVFNRTDYLLSPVVGLGAAWVAASQVTLSEVNS